MCGNSHLPPAPESGDLIAIIHPTPNPNQQSTIPFRGKLRLSNRLPGGTTSTLQYEKEGEGEGDDGQWHRIGRRRSGSGSRCGYGDGDGDGPVGNRRLHVRIHKFGQPLSMCGGIDNSSSSSSTSISSTPNPNPVLHSFFVHLDTVAGSTTAEIDTRLNLGVGGDGVVGRTVSVSILDMDVDVDVDVDASAITSTSGYGYRCRRKILGEGIIGWS